MLEKLITSFNGSCQIRTVSKNELKNATNEYHTDRILCRDWNYTPYKGIHDSRMISVRKFRRSSPTCKDDPFEFISNEVAIVRQMIKHKNVLKLLGCCLETKYPALVYEYGDGQLVSRESRLRIATELAYALAYLHNGISKVIIHRDIMPRYAFLDQDYVAKLSEFQISIPIPAGKTHVDAKMGGTIGYMASEVFSGRITEKSDVYNFGIVLSKIVTGKRIQDLLNSVENDSIKVISRRSSTFNFNIHEKESGFKYKESYLKVNILEEGNNRRQAMEFVELALSCSKMNI